MIKNTVVKLTKPDTQSLADYDRQLGCVVGGADEAGRGPLAGPVVCAAVIMPLDNILEGINDSKALTEIKREKLYDQIIACAIEHSVAVVDNKIIDLINIHQASLQGLAQAVNGLKTPTGIMLIDGNAKVKGALRLTKEVIRGDATSYNIAAASIIAKVTRDRMMREYNKEKEYAGYGFAVHKGYPTAAHFAAIRELGITKIHRMSFLRGKD